jgi:outer membrane cobalamin receptor
MMAGFFSRRQTPNLNIRRNGLLFLSLLFLLLSINQGVAAEDSLADLLKATEEKVGETVVVGASKRVESIGNSPSIVTVFTRSQIEKMHVTNLYELLSMAPGVELNESYFGFTSINVRGVNQSVYNNKLLLVMNGHPIFEGVNGNAHFEMIPTHAIKKVEIIRGPGSVLYGTNAFAGVVNVTTIDGAGYEKSSVSLEGGSFGTQNLRFNYVSRSTNNDGGLLISGTLGGSEGWNYRVGKDEQGKAGSFDYQDDVDNLLLHYKQKEVTVQFGVFSQVKDKLGITPVLAYQGLNEFTGKMYDIFWDHKLDSKSQVKLRFSHDEYTRFFKVGYFPARPYLGVDSEVKNTSPSRDFRYELQYSRTLTSKLSLITGLNLERFEADPYLFKFETTGEVHPLSAFLDKHHTENESVYLQLDYVPSRKLNLLGAVRQTKNDQSGTNIVPRFGGVYQLDKDFNLKVLYGKAFRNASIFERHVQTYNVLFGNAALEDEKIAQWDIALEKKIRNRFDVRLNYFSLETDDLITRQATTNAVLTGAKAAEYTNSKGQEIKGVEFELRGDLNRNTDIYLNLAQRRGTNIVDGSKALDFAREVGNLALNHSFNQRFSWNNQLQYIGKRETIIKKVEDSLPAYQLYHTSFDYQAKSNFKISLIVKNVLDKEYEHLEYNRHLILGIPGGPERGVYLRADYQF